MQHVCVYGFMRTTSSIGNIDVTEWSCSLQRESVDMNLRLRNRQAVRGELSQFVDDLVVTEQLILTITETPVGEQLFLEQLQILDHKETNNNIV